MVTKNVPLTREHSSSKKQYHHPRKRTSSEGGWMVGKEECVEMRTMEPLIMSEPALMMLAAS